MVVSSLLCSLTGTGSLLLCPQFDNSSLPARLSQAFSAQNFYYPCAYSRRGFVSSAQLSSVLSHVQLFATPWTAAHQASVSITNSQSLLKLMFIESVMPSNHLILRHPLLLPLSIFPSIRVFSSELILRIRVFSSELILRIKWPKY